MMVNVKAQHPRPVFKSTASWIKADGGQAFSTGVASEICLNQQHLHVISEHTASPERSRSSVELGGWGWQQAHFLLGVYLQEVKRSDLSELIWHLFKGTNTAEECACVKVPWFWGWWGRVGGWGGSWREPTPQACAGSCTDTRVDRVSCSLPSDTPDGKDQHV